MTERKLRAADLFCGAGGAAMGMHRAGFEVEGWDINPQPHYPFKFHLGDALEADLTGFDFVWASPPCQKYSRTAKIMEGKGIPNPRAVDLVPVTRRKLNDYGLPYIMENVPGAALINPGMLCGTMFGLGVLRHRLFESNILMLFPAHTQHNGGTGSHRGYSNGHAFITVGGHNYNTAQGKRAMGIDWMTRDELNEAIPPAYSEFLCRQVIAQLKARHTPTQAPVKR